MGSGYYAGGKFVLNVIPEFPTTVTQLQPWRHSFEHASRILHDATDGQMQIGEVRVMPASGSWAQADALLRTTVGKSISSVHGLGTLGMRMTLMRDEQQRPYIVVHELGHYLFGLYDEYDAASVPQCTAAPLTGACIMEFGHIHGDQIDASGAIVVHGTVNEFCSAANHTAGNLQHSYYGHSCWNQMKVGYDDLQLPMGAPESTPPPPAVPPTWTILTSLPKYVLLLDKSSSTGATGVLEGLRAGADFWLHYVARATDESDSRPDSLALVAYDEEPQTVLKLTALTEATDLTPISEALERIRPGGLTNLGGALGEAKRQVDSQKPSGTQITILATDGVHNVGVPPDNLIRSFVHAGIQIYTIGIGPNADQATLQLLANNTVGAFHYLDPSGTSAGLPLLLQNHYIELSGVVRDGVGITEMAAEVLPPHPAPGPPAPGGVDEQPTPFRFEVEAAGYDHQTLIEATSEQATFVLSHEQNAALEFQLVRPDGRLVAPDRDPDATWVRPENAAYSLFIIEDPGPGYWIMRVRRGQDNSPLPFKLFAFSESPGLHIAIDGDQEVHPVGAPIPIRVQAFHRAPLTGLPEPVLRIVDVDYAKKKTKPRSVRLRHVLSDFEGQTDLLPAAPSGIAGVYLGELTFTEPGSYQAEVQVANPGTATYLTDAAEPDQPVPPAFVRIQRFQIHVGPLSAGNDVENKSHSN